MSICLGQTYFLYYSPLKQHRRGKVFRENILEWRWWKYENGTRWESFGFSPRELFGFLFPTEHMNRSVTKCLLCKLTPFLRIGEQQFNWCHTLFKTSPKLKQALKSQQITIWPRTDFAMINILLELLFIQLKWKFLSVAAKTRRVEDSQFGLLSNTGF